MMTTTITADVLMPAERAALHRAEKVIRKGLDTFIKVGSALTEIRDQRLYRATHDTFEDYLADRWGLSKSYGNRLIQAYEVTRIVAPTGAVPATESQARELAPLLTCPERLREAWSRVIQAVRPPTASAVRAAVQQIRSEPTFPKPDPQPASPPEGPESGGPGTVRPWAAAGETLPSAIPAEAEGKVAGQVEPEPMPVDGPLLTDAEICESLTDPLSLHYLEEFGCRLALLAVAEGSPLDAAVARASRITVTAGQLPARIAGGAR